MNRLFVTVAAASLAALTACSNAASNGAGSAGAARAAASVASEDPNTVVATINGEKVTLGDLDKPIKGKLRALDQQIVEQKHQLRQSGLEALVAKKLVEAEAKKKGVSEEELIKTEVEAKVAAPTEEEMKAFYDQRVGASPGAPPYEAVKDRIAQFMTADKQRQAMVGYFDQLKAAAKVELNLPEPAMPKVEVAATGPSKGPENAKITIVEFSDFECPFCSRVNDTVAQVMKEYEGQVRVVFRDYPLPFHANAPKAAEAGHCAAEQGKFWEMHDKLFSNQKALGVNELKGYAKELGLDQAKFDSCLDEGKMAEAVKKNAEAGEEAGVQGTPAFFINGTPLSGAVPFEEFKKVIDKELGIGGATASK